MKEYHFLLLKAALAKFNIELFDPQTAIIQKWNEPHRYYHNMEHLTEIIDLIVDSEFSDHDRDLLVIVAFFHDIIYNPLSKTNEEDSAALWEQVATVGGSVKDIKTISQIILDTKDHVSSSELSKRFLRFDIHGLLSEDVSRLISDGIKIMKEFQYYDYSLYRVGRDEIIRKFAKKIPENRVNIEAYLQWLQWYRPRVGIYAGSFNPFHIGHMEILKRAEETFDKVIVAVGINPDKTNVDEKFIQYESEIRKAAIQQILPFHQVEIFNGLLTDYAKEKEKSGVDVTIIKGLRDGDDLKYEMNQLRYMERMVKSNIKIVFIPGGPGNAHVSSSGLRSIMKIDPELAREYLPVPVELDTWLKKNDN